MRLVHGNELQPYHIPHIFQYTGMPFPSPPTSNRRVSLNHDGTDESDGTDIQSVSPVPSASVAGPSVPSVSNSRRKLTRVTANCFVVGLYVFYCIEPPAL